MESDLPPAYSTVVVEDTTDLTDTAKIFSTTEHASEIFGSSFETKSSQIGFIQKVLTIKLLQVMLVSTILVTGVAIVRGFDEYSPVMYFDGLFRVICMLLATMAFLAVIWSLNFFNIARTAAPYNYMFLVAYPVTFSFVIYLWLYGYGIKSFMLSWLHFNAVVFVLLLYSILALQTNVEFKPRTALYIAAGILIVAYALTVPFSHRINPYKVLLFSITLLLITAYILHDMEAMMSNDYRTSLAPGDFVKAAVLMHVDHWNLLMRIYDRIRPNPA